MSDADDRMPDTGDPDGRILDAIANLVAEESSNAPLSDQEILEILNERGIQIARRTVAKYRIALKIAPSHMRKQYN